MSFSAFNNIVPPPLRKDRTCFSKLRKQSRSLHFKTPLFSWFPALLPNILLIRTWPRRFVSGAWHVTKVWHDSNTRPTPLIQFARVVGSKQPILESAERIWWLVKWLTWVFFCPPLLIHSWCLCFRIKSLGVEDWCLTALENVLSPTWWSNLLNWCVWGRKIYFVKLPFTRLNLCEWNITIRKVVLRRVKNTLLLYKELEENSINK